MTIMVGTVVMITIMQKKKKKKRKRKTGREETASELRVGSK